MKVLLEAPILTKSGYGEHSRLVLKALEKNIDLNIFIDPLNWGTCSWDIQAVNDKDHQYINNLKAYRSYCESLGEKEHYDVQIHVGVLNEFQKKAE